MLETTRNEKLQERLTAYMVMFNKLKEGEK